MNRAGDILSKYQFREPETLPEAEFECPTHGKFRGNPVKMIGFLTGEGRIVDPECPKCAAEREAGIAKKEAEVEKQRRINRLINMNIDKKYWNEDFNTFDAYTPELVNHLKVCREFAKNPQGKLVMLGNNGTGKNHLAVSILKETGGVIYTFFEICLMLKQSYDGAVNREWEILQKFCETSLLIIDEIGRTKGSDWEMNWLSHVFNKRHANYRPTILISNRHLMKDCPEGEKGCPKCLENFFDNDVISRIIEDGHVLKFMGDDYRYKIRQIGGKKQ